MNVLSNSLKGIEITDHSLGTVGCLSVTLIPKLGNNIFIGGLAVTGTVDKIHRYISQFVFYVCGS